MIVLIIVVILLCSAMSDYAAAEDWESSERNAELRHEEMMEVLTYKKPRTVHKKNRTIRKRAIKDSYGNTLVEEVIVESLEGIRP